MNNDDTQPNDPQPTRTWFRWNALMPVGTKPFSRSDGPDEWVPVVILADSQEHAESMCAETGFALGSQVMKEAT